KKETEYLEETPSGNIITGFESYTKGTTGGIGGGAAGGRSRRGGGVSEGNRVFSRSSVSFNANAVCISCFSAKGKGGSGKGEGMGMIVRRIRRRVRRRGQILGLQGNSLEANMKDDGRMESCLETETCDIGVICLVWR